MLCQRKSKLLLPIVPIRESFFCILYLERSRKVYGSSVAASVEERSGTWSTRHLGACCTRKARKFSTGHPHLLVTSDLAREIPKMPLWDHARSPSHHDEAHERLRSGVIPNARAFSSGRVDYSTLPIATKVPIRNPPFPKRNAPPPALNALSPMFARFYSQALCSQDFTRTSSSPPPLTPMKPRFCANTTQKFFLR